MRLFCKCGCQLMIQHEIALEVRSNFTWVDGIITLTKHHLLNTKGIKPSVKEEDVTLLCRDCGKNIDIEEAHIQCDNCKSHVAKNDSKKFGGTIVLCPRCINSCKDFETFKLFGTRGPSAKTRQSRINEALTEAVEARPEIPQELIDIYEAEETEASNPDDPFDGVENVVVEIPRVNTDIDTSTWNPQRWVTNSIETGRMNTGDE